MVEKDNYPQELQKNETVARISGILKALRGINRILVKEKDKHSIIVQVCDLLFQTREYQGVWIVLVDSKGHLLDFASAEKSKKVDQFYDQLKNNKWPSILKRCKKKQGFLVVDNPSQTCKDCSLNQQYANRSAYVTPLFYEGVIYGYISASVPSKYSSIAMEQEMFTEMAEDIASAFYRIDMEYDFVQLFEDAPDGFILVEKNLTINNVNPAFTRITDIPKEEVVGKKSHTLATKFLKVSEVLKVLPFINSMMTGNSVSQFELKYRNQQLAISTSFRGKSKYHVVIIKDITEVKKTKQAVIESEIKYKNLVETMHDSVFIIQDEIVQYVNEALCRVSGFSREEVIGQNFIKFIMPEKVEQAKLYFSERLSGKPVPYKYQSVARSKNGKLLDVEVTTISIEYNDKPAFQVIVRDITEQKAYEKALLDSEEKFRFLSMSTFEGIVVHDKGKVLDVNEAFLKLTGYPREEVIGEFLLDYLVSATDKAKVVRNMVKQSAKPYLVKGRRKDGTFFVAELEGKYVYHNGEKVRIAAVRDVTERHQLQKQIQESERKLKTLLANLPGVAYRCSNLPNWPMEFLSEGFHELTGYHSSEIIEKHRLEYGDIIHPEDRSYVWDRIQEALAINESFEIEYRITTKKGKVIWVWERGRCVDTSKGKILEGFIIDISESKMAEISIKESEKRFKQIFELAPTGIAQSKSDGFISVNEKICQIFGYTRQEMLSGLNFTKITHPEDIDKSIDVTESSVNHPGKVFTMDKRYIRKDGSVIWGRIYLTGLADEKGEFKHHLISIQDITQQKLVEDEMRLFKTISDKALYGSGIIDISGKLTYVNDYFAQIHGYSPKELVGKPLSVFHDTDQLEEVIRINEEILAKGNVETREVGHMRKNGTHFSMLMSFVLIRGEKNEPKFIAATAIDLTDVKNAQKTIKLSESKFKALFNGISDAVFVHPFSVEGFHRFTEVNTLACERYGYTRDELLAIGPQDITIYEDATKQGRKAARRKLADAKWSVFEATHVTKNGEQFPVEISSRIFEMEGKPIIMSLVRDITQHKQAENELKQSVEKFRSIFENKGTATAIINEEGQILLANDQCTVISGYSVMELQSGMRWDHLAHSDDLPMLFEQQELRKSNPDIAKKAFESRLVTKDGRFKNVLVNIDIMSTDNSRVISLIDISDRIEAELKLQQSERKFRSYIQNAPYGIFIADAKGYYLDVNLEAERLTGYIADELIGMNLLDLIAPEHKQMALDNFKQFVQSGVHETIEIKYLRKDGQEKYWSVSAVKISEERFLGFVTDVTDRIEDQLQLLSLFNDQKIMLDNDPTLIFFKDTQNNIIRVTDSVAKISGMTREQIEGKHSNLIYPKMADKYWQDDQEVIRSGNPKGNIIEPMHTNDGDVKWLLTNKIPYRDEDGEIVGIIVFSTDITKLIHAEEELLEKNKELTQAKERAEESDRLKSAFLANMSHEIRTPMNGILGFTSLLEEPDLSGNQQKEYVKIIQKSGQRMLNTINDLVDISRIEAGQVEVSLSEFDVSNMIHELVEFFKPECEAKNITLVNILDLNNPIIIKSDSYKLNSILTNLIKNAIKFTDLGSIKINCNPMDKWIEFSVEDTGVGIPYDRQQAVFDRFVQADIADSRAFQGSGLGLSITKSYVEMLGGYIRLQSEEGQGSVFSFTLPNTVVQVKEEKVVTQNYLPIDTQNKKLKILIAEDDEPSFLHLSILLKNFASEILRASDGKVAVELCKEHPDIDLILMDIKMPVMDGVTATREIRRFNTQVHIMAQTAYALVGENQNAMAAGCNDYITKPIDREELESKIKMFINT